MDPSANIRPSPASFANGASTAATCGHSIWTNFWTATVARYRIPPDVVLWNDDVIAVRADSGGAADAEGADVLSAPRWLDDINEAFDRHAPDGVDLCLAGVGPEGHFAFNEDPNFRHVEVSDEEFLADRTRLVLVNTSTVDMDALVASCGDRSAVPPFAVTIGPHDVLRETDGGDLSSRAVPATRAAGNAVSRSHVHVPRLRC